MSASVLVVTRLLREPGDPVALHWRALETIFRLDWPGQIDHLLQNGGDEPGQRLENCHRKCVEARERALRGDYEAVLFADHDLLLPPDTLTRLWNTGASIAYGLHVLRHERDGYRWNAAAEVTPRQWRSFSDDPERARACFGQVAPVAGMGFGCALIRRDVLKSFAMRWFDHAGDDWALALDAQAADIEQVCDLSVVCGHLDAEHNRIFWPDVERPNFYRLEEIND